MISCVDGLLRTAIDDLEASLGTLEGDRLLVPGGPLALLGLAPERESVLRWVELLVTKKHLRRIVLVSHQHCLAYMQKLGSSLHDERESIERDLTLAKGLLESRFRGVRVECWIVPWRETRLGAGYDEAEPVEARPSSAAVGHGQDHANAQTGRDSEVPLAYLVESHRDVARRGGSVAEGQEVAVISRAKTEPSVTSM